MKHNDKNDPAGRPRLRRQLGASAANLLVHLRSVSAQAQEKLSAKKAQEALATAETVEFDPTRIYPVCSEYDPDSETPPTSQEQWLEDGWVRQLDGILNLEGDEGCLMLLLSGEWTPLRTD